ncbi:hypothetical protein CGRA01v4_10673 [Colletotrichum graminicola]|uniref:Uncharacterized protein n=1 Tax=Colletotrichum graminicola (strain M1.001 / M2 / FGSC 10212) TaxID=645133 RepID=E3QKH1_COLGM|nr:uncharacterized protein GLRG_06503 [Colletotrichum graminicola M1.001]EFQ31359.1 hypothetical protein GLRG_06503 [Colletotrichum graminicola M1.001]WDK19386.1 hypothetical protein CGRA01v4_10673 [Colletotrichum graminicola]
MLISNIFTTVITACAVLGSAASAADFKLKKSGKANCSSQEGPARDYNRGACHPLYSTDHGMRILEHNTACKIRCYPGGNCDGNVVRAFSSHQCHSLQGCWSFRVEC